MMMSEVFIPEHGDRNTYRKYGCRCTPCKTANNAYVNEKRLEQLAIAKHEMDQQEFATGSRKVPTWRHGILKTAIGKGCRCDECKPLFDEYRKRQRRRTNARQFVNSILEEIDDRPAAN